VVSCTCARLLLRLCDRRTADDESRRRLRSGSTSTRFSLRRRVGLQWVTGRLRWLQRQCGTRRRRRRRDLNKGRFAASRLCTTDTTRDHMTMRIISYDVYSAPQLFVATLIATVILTRCRQQPHLRIPPPMRAYTGYVGQKSGPQTHNHNSVKSWPI